MEKTSFQPPELRDANNNIIQEGTYSVKNGVLANAQNTGVLDYINNNLQALQDNVVDLQSSSLAWEYVDQLPVPSEANPNAIYAVPQTDEQGNRYYIEYRLINGTWQVFGSTKVDITQAVMKADVLDNIKPNSTLPVQSVALANALAEKANVGDSYTKAEANQLINSKAEANDVYNKGEVNNLLDEKANVGDSYTKAEADTLLDDKADKSTTYTKTEVDSIADGKLDKSGDTITGNLFFPIADADVTTSVTYAGRDLTFQDKAGKRIAIIRCIQSGTKKGVDIYAFGTDNVNKGALSVYSNGDGTTVAEIPTPATTDNSTKIATTAFVNEYALAKNGGTMSGAITSSAHDQTLRSNTDANYTQILGATVYSKGASITLYGKDNNNGQVMLVANDGSNSNTLFCKSNGSLTWAGKEIERVNASGTNYIRYESGLQICWEDSSSKGLTGVIFPQAFSVYPCVLARHAGGTVVQNITDLTLTGFKGSSQYISYIAIGKWK